MPTTCCVHNCNSTQSDNIRFFSIPIKNRHNTELNDLSRIRIQKWLDAIKSKDLIGKDEIKNIFVCAKHFISGKPAPLLNDTDIDWVPSLYMVYEHEDLKNTKNTPTLALATASIDLNSQSLVSTYFEHNYSATNPSFNCTTVGQGSSNEVTDIIDECLNNKATSGLNNEAVSMVDQSAISKLDQSLDSETISPGMCNQSSDSKTTGDQSLHDIIDQCSINETTSGLNNEAVSVVDQRTINKVDQTLDSGTVPYGMTYDQSSYSDVAYHISDQISNNDADMDTSVFTNQSIGHMNIVQKCFCCLDSNPTMDIFKTVYESPYLEEKEVAVSHIFSSLLGIKIDENGSFTHLICDDCLQLLTSFYDFKFKVFRSYNTLRKNNGELSLDLNITEDSQQMDIKEFSEHIHTFDDSCYNYDVEKNHKSIDHKISEVTDIHQNVSEIVSKDHFVRSDLPLPDKAIQSQRNFNSDKEATMKQAVKVSLSQNTLFKSGIDDKDQLQSVRSSLKLPHKPVQNPPVGVSQSTDLPQSTCFILPRATEIPPKRRRRKRNKQLPRVNRPLVPILPRPQVDVIIIRREVEGMREGNAVNENVKEPLNNCHLCGEKMASKQHLKSHLAAHSRKPVTCEICGKELSSRQVLKKHVMIHSGKKFVCSICDRGFTYNYELTQHMNVHEMKQTYPCGHCDMVFLTSIQLKNHKGDIRRRAKFTCEICRKSMYTKARYQHHMVSHKENAEELKPFSCEFCGKRFLFESYLKRHQRCHQSDKTLFTCDVCGKCVSSQQNLKKHRMLHFGKEYNCRVCGKGFTENYELKNHMNIHERKEKFLCSHCGKVFQTAIHLRRHHSDLRRRRHFTCHICGKSMSNKASYEIHLTTHGEYRDKLKLFKCSTCGKKFAHQLLLKNHLWRHKSKFRCQKCHVVYSEQDLRTHDCRQSDEAEPFDNQLPNECRHCGKILFDLDKLEVHLRQHEGRKCQQCDVTFMTTRELRFHINKHNMKCQHCDKYVVRY